MALQGTCLGKKTPTVFDAEAIPPISLEDYLSRILSSCGVSVETLIRALIHIDMLVSEGVVTEISPFNVHRLLASALFFNLNLQVSSPFDRSAWSLIAGMSLAEVNRLETTVKDSLGPRICISEEVFQVYQQQVQQLLFKHNLPERQTDLELYSQPRSASTSDSLDVDSPFSSS